MVLLTDTARVVEEWVKKDDRIKYIQVGRMGRIAAVSNAALRIARGEFVAVLDDDDWWIDAHKLEKQVAFLDAHPDYVACGGWFVVTNANGEEVTKVKKPESDAAIRAHRPFRQSHRERNSAVQAERRFL